MTRVYYQSLVSYFRKISGFAFLFIFCTISSLAFVHFSFSKGSQDLTAVVNTMRTLVVVLTPVVAASSYSQDSKYSLESAYYSLPISPTSWAIGRFFASFTLCAISVSILFVFGVIINYYIYPNWAYIWCVFFALLLVAGFTVSLCQLISVITGKFWLTSFIYYSILILALGADLYAKYLANPIISKIVGFVSFKGRFSSFPFGLSPLDDVLYFALATLIFVFLISRVLAYRQWKGVRN